MTSSPTFSPTENSFPVDLFYSLPIGSGLLSLMGSTLIVFVILRQNRLSSTYGRLIFGMSCMDIMQSLAFCFSTFLSPDNNKETILPFLGNSTTCSIQGFFLYTGITGTTIYYCSLCIYYILVLLKGVALKSIKHRFERYLHAIPLLFSFTCGIFLAATENFNNAGSVCWIAPFPPECRLDLDTCTRGKHAFLFRWVLQGIPVIICFIVILVTMMCLIYKMKRQRNLMRKYQFNVPEDIPPNNTSQIQCPPYASSRQPSLIETASKNTTYRALQYIAAFFFTFIFTMINQIIFMMSRGPPPIVLLMLQQITSPAQGFFNFIVFMLPVMKAVKKKDPQISLFKSLLKAIISRKKRRRKYKG